MLGMPYSSPRGKFPMPSIIRGMSYAPPRRQPPREPAERDTLPLQTDFAQPRSPRIEQQQQWIEQLRRANVVVPDVESVARFVKRFPDAARALDDGLRRIQDRFQDADRLVLETFDEESGSNNPEEQTLLLIVELKSPAPDALKRLEEVDEAWWYGLPPQTKLRVAAHVTLR